MINHKISTIPKHKFAKQSEAAGGHAIKLFATVRLDVANLGWITEGDSDSKKRLGQYITFKIDKLKNSSMLYTDVPKIALLNTTGFDTTANLLDAGVKSGWIHHTKGSKDYKLSDISFPKADWPAIVDEDLGGIHEAYQEFYAWCMEQGFMQPWGVTDK